MDESDVEFSFPNAHPTTSDLDAIVADQSDKDVASALRGLPGCEGRYNHEVCRGRPLSIVLCFQV